MSSPSPAGSFTHPALLYRGLEEYLAGTLAFIRSGLAMGEPVAVAVPDARLELLRSELGAGAETVHFIDMAQIGRNPGRIIPRVLRAFADAHPGRRVRIIGESVWPGRSAAEYGTCVQHEALVNHAFAGRSLTVLCPYDAAALDPRVIADARLTHPVVIDAEGARSSSAFAPDRAMRVYDRPLVAPTGVSAMAFDEELLPHVRDFAAGEARRLGLSSSRVQDLALAVAELTTNSVLHGGGQGTLRVWAVPDGSVVCQVEDRGRITDPLAGRVQPPPHEIGGRGLLLVHYVCDLVRIHAGRYGSAVRIHLDS